ncbi:MAG: DUF2384 domain-containing protein [Mesorhizobium sp.]|uniref:antitoxin Xre/MbcA/ParS-like domain-containing protein n=1 Tax=Mesorhizobium sp. TaxID=1871066 RepID=UPI000FE4D65C|nr:antitoxin Xre/MbcA/ParS toxin-binding domain-containing protein [Mesorhizobium sp.]RWP86665.1 MAG: DUF2384 domain-containing protein [Mesorhizobium sp.]
MIGSRDLETRETELSTFVIKEVQRILAQCDEAKQTEEAAVVLAGSSANELAAEVLARLEAEASRRLNAEARASESEGARITDWAGPVAGPTHLEKRFGIPRSTLHWWQRHNDVVALRRGARKHVFPLAQFIDGRPTPGIRQVLSSISDPRLAWLWLIRPSPFLGGRVPIDMLREDSSIEVGLAARAFSLVPSS